jgi:uncharacterized protein YjbJ (UPF0337 family)
VNRLQFGGTWNEAKGKIKQKYAQLTDDDLKYADGKDEEWACSEEARKISRQVRQIL